MMSASMARFWVLLVSVGFAGADNPLLGSWLNNGVNGSTAGDGRSPESTGQLARRLEYIEIVDNWQFPAGTTLTIGSTLATNRFGSGVASDGELYLLAGYKYSSILLEMPLEFQFPLTGNLKLLSGRATREECHLNDHIVPMGTSISGDVEEPSVLGMGSTVAFSYGASDSALLVPTQSPWMVFMHGGSYQLCYAPDGSFHGDELRNNLVPQLIQVVGVYGPCSEEGCLQEQSWECYFTYRAEIQGPCRVDLRTYGGRSGWGVTSFGTGKLTWTSAWAKETYVGNDFQTAARQACSDALGGLIVVPDRLKFLSTTVPFLDVDSSSAATLPALNSTEAHDAFTVSICYCPNYAGHVDGGEFACDDTSEFIQPVGVLQYWMLRICDTVSFAACGESDFTRAYARVHPQQAFVVRLQCPSGGCGAGSSANRLKLIAADPLGGTEDERLSWEPQHRCKLEDEAFEWFQWVSGSTVTETDQTGGGDRQDYKVWPDPYLVTTWSTDQAFDVCFCRDSCENPLNYFKVGVVRTVSFFAIARQTRAATNGVIDPIPSIEFMNEAGCITLYGGITTSALSEELHPFDAPPFSRRAILKLISFDRDAIYEKNGSASLVTLEEAYDLSRSQHSAGNVPLDLACSSTAYNADLVVGPASAEEAIEFQAWVPEGEIVEYLPFSGRENDQSFLPSQAGILVVCYCAMLDEAGLCTDSSNWIHAAKILVRGPAGGTTLTFPTNFVIQLSLYGWGFQDSDTLRFIGLTQSCSENAFNPTGVGGYRRGCPGLNQTDCRQPALNEDISTWLDSANTSGVYISSLEIGEYNSTLTFTDDITSILQDGDAITIDDASVTINGNGKGNWTDAQQFLVSVFTGVHAYADDTTRTRILWNKVSNLYSGGVMDTQKLTIPVGLPLDERPDSFAFTGRGGLWVRRNRLRTREELKVEAPVEMKVCWGANVGGEYQHYYGEAARVIFANPDPMADAGVYLTAEVVGAQAPVVISFAPQPDRTAYQEFDVPIVLRLLFRDLEKLEPLLAGAADQPLEPLDPNTEVPMEAATQAFCGQLFVEMWTNDVNGFPLPRGCYAGREYQDQPSVDIESGDLEPTLARYREYFVIFEPRNGLKTTCLDSRNGKTRPCLYQLVLNARLGVIHIGDELVSIYTLCADHASDTSVCGPPYSVIEYGRGDVPQSTQVHSNTTASLASVDVTRWGSSSTGITAEDPLELVDETGSGVGGFAFQAWVKSYGEPIQRQAYLTVFFLPLTIWDLGVSNGCSAVCIPPQGYECSDGKGGSSATCSLEQSVDTSYSNIVSMQKNVLKLVYPGGMDVIPVERSNESHVLAVEGLQFPTYGFLPVRFLARLTDDGDGDPSIAYAVQSVFQRPPQGSTTGRLLVEGQSGSGARPFAGEHDNEVIARITLGLTLYSQRTSPNTEAPTLSLSLPEGYTCSVVGTGLADPTGTHEIFQRDADGDGFLDFFVGTLLNGVWTAGSNLCTFTLDPYAQIYAGQSFHVLLSVENPQEALARDDPKNTWFVNLTAINGTTEPYLSDEGVAFMSLTEELSNPGWAGNLAVLTPLHDESVQPSGFALGAENVLSVFFRAVHGSPALSYLLLDAPVGFDFGATCNVSDLDPSYYADWQGLAWGEHLTGEMSLTRPLGSNVTCAGEQWERHVLASPPTANFSRARIRISRPLVIDTYWGFRIQIRNAWGYDSTQHDSWRLWIQSPDGYPMSGSEEPVQFNPLRIGSKPAFAYDRGWSVYGQPFLRPLALNMTTASVLPTSVIQLSARVILFPLEVDVEAGLSSVRILAPVGYEWDLSAPFLGAVPGTTCADCTLEAEPVVPPEYPNELILSDVVLRVGRQYGVVAYIKVPDTPPTRSMHAFFVELGYTAGTGQLRMHAGVLEPPELRVVRDAQVHSLCNVANAAGNVMEFTLTIASEIPAGGGFVLEGSEATRYTQLGCPPQQLAGTSPLPSDLLCSFFLNDGAALPVVTISSSSSGFPAGDYGFRFVDVRNPIAATEALSTWTVGTYLDVSAYPRLQVLDRAALVPAPHIKVRMAVGQLLSPPEWEAGELGRDDRPGAWNHLLFYFSLSEDLAVAPDVSSVTIALRGPHGFLFDDDCLSTLYTIPSNLSDGTSLWPCSGSDLANQSWCPSAGFEAWPDGWHPTDCTGIGGNTAKVVLPVADRLIVGFQKSKVYAFRIRAQNPYDNEEVNLWALDVGSEASYAFESFTVRTFDVAKVQILPVSQSVASLGDPQNVSYLPIPLHFVPSLEVPGIDASTDTSSDTSEGSIILDAPTGFEFLSDQWGMCTDVLLEEEGRLPQDLDAQFTINSDIICAVESSNRLTIRLVGAKSLHRLVAYRLVPLVRNPLEPQAAAPWLLQSYKRRVSTSKSIALDRTSVPGFEVFAALGRWLAENGSREHRGEFPVHEVALALTFSTSVQNGDAITVQAPGGFNLDAGNGLCSGFAWPSATVPLPHSPEPFCSCAESGNASLRCSVSFHVQEVGDGAASYVVFQAGDELAFKLSTTNPASTVDLAEDWWVAKHIGVEGTVLATSAVAGWPVFAQLKGLVIDIIGEQRAGALSSLLLEFTPSAWGSTLELVMHEPLDFNFDSSAVEAPLQPLITEGSSRLVITGGEFLRNQATSILISGVRLGDPGGSTHLSLRLFGDVAMSREVGRELEHYGGFRLPGALEVLQQVLWSEDVVAYHDDGVADAILPVLPALGGELARVALHFNLTMPVQAGDLLMIRSVAQSGLLPSTLLAEAPNAPTLFMCLEDASAWNCNASIPIGDTYAITSEAMSDGLAIVLGQQEGVANALEAGTVYRLQFWCYGTAGLSLWEMVTEDGSAWPTNTNDGLTEAIGTVSRLSVTAEPYTVRCPPRSILDVVMTVGTDNTVTANITEIQVILPLGFTPYGTFLPAHAGDTERYVVRPLVQNLSLAQQEMHLKVYTPEWTTTDMRWFAVAYQRAYQLMPVGETSCPTESLSVTSGEECQSAYESLTAQHFLNSSGAGLQELLSSEAEAQGAPPGCSARYYDSGASNPVWHAADPETAGAAAGNATNGSSASASAGGAAFRAICPLEQQAITGWGFAAGFEVAPLTVDLRYAGIPSFTGWVAVSFAVPSSVQGQFVLVTAPPLFTISCPPSGTNQPELTCEDVTPGSLALPGLPFLERTLNVTLLHGYQEGQNMLYSFFLSLATPEFPDEGSQWSFRVLNEGFDVVDAVLGMEGSVFTPNAFLQNPVLSWQTAPQAGESSVVSIEVTFSLRLKYVRAILFTLPEMYRHDIQHKNQVKNVNEAFPVAAGAEWRYFTNLRWIRILTNVDLTIGIDSLPSGTFQWQFPVRVPFTDPYIKQWHLSFCSDHECEDPRGENILMSFPIPNTVPVKAAEPLVVATTAGALRATMNVVLLWICHMTQV